jgi:flagellar hook-associated protein 3 FlgL
MTRISENQFSKLLVNYTVNNKERVNKYSEQVATGLKASLPSDSEDAGVISRYKQTLDRIDGYMTTIARVKSVVQFQDDALSQMTDLITRAKEIAQQGANESLTPSARAFLAEEVYQIRDQVAGLGNSSFQGKYIYGGADDDDPPFDGTLYDEPATGPASVKYEFDAEIGTSQERSVRITDDMSMTLNTPGNVVFGTTIEALERLGRSLSGYATTPDTGPTDGGGSAYSFPADYTTQTADIKKVLDLLNKARDEDVIPERTALGGKMRRLQTAESLLTLTKTSAQEVLSRIQNADETESVASLSQAQTALQASYSVTAKVLRLTIMDYL